MAKISVLTTSVQWCTKVPGQWNRARKINNGYMTCIINIWKEDIKLSLFTNTIIKVENSKKSTKKILELIRGFSKTTKYKVNILEIKLILEVLFTIESKMKYLGINLTEDVQDLHSETHKTVLKEIKKDWT